MKFYTTNATGDSGLFYLAHWINKNFRFPFRVMSADIGLDAEIELLNDDLHSTGIVLKAQVKSTESAITEDFTEYIDKKHLVYWMSVVVPVIYFVVDTVNLKIYYKVLSSFDDIERTKETTETRWKISFDVTKDELTIDSKKEWIRLFSASEFHNTLSYFDQINSLLSGIITNVLDLDAFKRQSEKLDEAKGIREKLESIKRHYPWKFGKKLNEELEKIDDNIRITKNGLEQSITQAGYN